MVWGGARGEGGEGFGAGEEEVRADAVVGVEGAWRGWGCAVRGVHLEVTSVQVWGIR